MDNAGHNCLKLPPGFRFYPTDEELVVHFLLRKATILPCHPDVIPDLDVLPYYDPWDLDGKAMAEGNKWYFYTRRTQTRVARSGYWQAIGVDEPVYSSNDQRVLGLKKFLAFYLGQPFEGVKTNWVMQEYRLPDTNSSNRSSRQRNTSKTDYYSTWVVCQVYECSNNRGDEVDEGKELSCLDEVFLSMDDLDEISLPN